MVPCSLHTRHASRFLGLFLKRSKNKVESVCYKITLFSEAIQHDDTHSLPISILRLESIPALNLQKHDWIGEPTLLMNSRRRPIEVIKPKKITTYTGELRSCAGHYLVLLLWRPHETPSCATRMCRGFPTNHFSGEANLTQFDDWGLGIGIGPTKEEGIPVGKIKFPHLVGGEEGDSVGAAVAFFLNWKQRRRPPL